MKRKEEYKDIPIFIQGFEKKFKSFISVNNISFSVGEGSIHGFIGPNGSGKTTTIKSLIGAYKPTKGTLLIKGYKVGTAEANKYIGYIPERASFPKHLNCINYLVSMAQLSGLKKKDAKTKAWEILKDLNLDEQAKRRPTTFSSGMQKKILLAQSLITNPSILILDEPAANLDPTARKDFFDELIKLRDQGKTIFISSHILSELERIVDSVSFIYYGEMIYSGSVKNFELEVNSIFIKTNNNNALVPFLDKHRIKYKGDFETEVEILIGTKKEKDELFNYIREFNLEVISFRSNDLQTAYESLIKKSINSKKGQQTLKGKKINQNLLNQTKIKEYKDDLIEDIQNSNTIVIQPPKESDSKLKSEVLVSTAEFSLESKENNSKLEEEKSEKNIEKDKSFLEDKNNINHIQMQNNTKTNLLNPSRGREVVKLKKQTDTKMQNNTKTNLLNPTRVREVTKLEKQTDTKTKLLNPARVREVIRSKKQTDTNKMTILENKNIKNFNKGIEPLDVDKKVKPKPAKYKLKIIKKYKKR